MLDRFSLPAVPRQQSGAVSIQRNLRRSCGRDSRSYQKRIFVGKSCPKIGQFERPKTQAEVLLRPRNAIVPQGGFASAAQALAIRSVFLGFSLFRSGCFLFAEPIWLGTKFK